MSVVDLKKKSPVAEEAIGFICVQDERFGEMVKKMSIARAVQVMLHEGEYDLAELHRDGDLRQILHAFL